MVQNLELNNVGQMPVDISNCARCGEDHEQMIFSLLANASDEWKYFGMCPVTDQPVMLRICGEYD